MKRCVSKKSALLVAMMLASPELGLSWTMTTSSPFHLGSSHRLAAASTCEECPETSVSMEERTTNYRAFFTPSWVEMSNRGFANPWESILPWMPNTKGCDVSVVWDRTNERAAVDRILHTISQPTDRTLALKRQRQSLLESLQAFASLTSPSTASFKARIVSTRGVVGTKCPRWHADHVPIRWIQSLVGPGCDYVVGECGVDRGLLNGVLDDDVTTAETNKLLVASQLAHVRQGREGESVVLIGHDNVLGLPAAIHKSPTLRPWQGRVLLTIDEVRD